MFRRILIANRGEIALRIVRACHELGIEAVAVYSTADASCAHVLEADHAVCIGPPPPVSSYLSIANVISAARISGCEAVHPGYGFLAENTTFARSCEQQDLVFIGPTPKSMDDLGDKSLAKQLMAEAGLPTIPGSRGTVGGIREAERVAGKLGYPVMLKAVAGGGGRGMRLVDASDQLERAFLAAAAELGVAPESCFVVEDAVSGITAAKAGNMAALAVARAGDAAAGGRGNGVDKYAAGNADQAQG